MSLEVDHRVGALYGRQPQKEVNSYSSEKESHLCTATAVKNRALLGASIPTGQLGPKKTTTWLLAITLGVVTVLAIVAAAVGGSTAVKRTKDLIVVRSQLQKSDLALQQCASDHNGDSTNTTSTSQPSTNANDTTTNTTSISTTEDLKPTSNCSSMGSGETYIAAFTKSLFTVRCGIDYTGGDSMGVWVHTFAACMEACASWNDHQIDPPCYAVSYDISDDFTEEGGIGNCFLKRVKGIPPKGKKLTDSAVADLGD